MAVLKTKDAAGAWVDAAEMGPTGPTGPIGPSGPTGPRGVASTLLGKEVAVGNNQPTDPSVELWYDLDESPPGSSQMPTGGAAGEVAVKLSDTHYDVGWAQRFPLTGGTVAGDLAVAGDASVNGVLTAPVVAGDTYFNNNISANRVTDRSNPYAWEELDVSALLVGNWHSDLAIGPCKAWRNEYMVLVNLCIGSNPEIAQEAWLGIATLPAGWRPGAELWQTAPSVDVRSDSATTENRIGSDGLIQLRGKALMSPDPQITSRYSIYHCYPRSA